MASSKSLFVLIGLMGIILLLSFELVSASEQPQQTEEKANKANYGQEKNIYGGQGWLPGSSSGYGNGYLPGYNSYGGFRPGFDLGDPNFGALPHGDKVSKEGNGEEKMYQDQGGYPRVGFGNGYGPRFLPIRGGYGFQQGYGLGGGPYRGGYLGGYPGYVGYP